MVFSARACGSSSSGESLRVGGHVSSGSSSSASGLSTCGVRSVSTWGLGGLVSHPMRNSYALVVG
jgi:hypothetical protein